MRSTAALITIQRLMLNRRFSYIASVVAAILLSGVEFGAASGHEQQPAVASKRQDLSDMLPEKPVDKGVLFVHRRLMHVTLSKTEPVALRYVECRHYAKEHQKLVQTGLSPEGHALLRMVQGDYCEFAGSSPTKIPQTWAPGKEAVAPGNPGLPASEWDHMTEFQRYTCEKFGDACQVALAVQQAENAVGACEIYHYNSSDGTLDWGYFQINTVHLTRPGLNLRDLLDCKKNIDFAYSLYREKGFTPWVTYLTGAYRKYLPHNAKTRLLQARMPQLPSVRSLVPTY